MDQARSDEVWFGSNLREHFYSQFLSKIGKGKPVKQSGLTGLQHRFVFKVSDTYFNRNPSEIKHRISKRNILKSFVADIQQEANLRESPSRVKRYVKHVVQFDLVDAGRRRI